MKNESIIKKPFINRNSGGKCVFTLLVLLSVLMPFKFSKAQVTISVNIVSQPLWGPVGYDYVEYYYLPEAEVYYYVPTAQFYYLNSGRWVYATYLPPIYHIDLYNTYKVVVNEPRPYLHHHAYVTRYGKYKTYRGKQVIIRNSNDKKYYVVKGHPGATKVKTVKPKSSRGNNAQPNNSGGKSYKPSQSRGNNSQGNNVGPSNSKGHGSDHGGSKGNSPNGKGGRNK